MDIRVLTGKDAEEYWALRLEALQNSPEAFSSSYEEALQKKDPIMEVERNLTSEGAYTFGAYHEGKLVGVTTLVQEKNLKLKHRANILAVYVTPTVRGLGVGKALMQAAMDKARTIVEIEKVNLTVVSTNEPANRLYKSFGFQTFGVEEKAMIVNDQYVSENLMTIIIR